VSIPQLDYGHISSYVQQANNEIAEALDAAQEEKEAYQNEIIRSLHAIEQNTANLHTLLDLISKSNEQQEELIQIVAEILGILTAKSQKEAQSSYSKVMGRITQTVKEAEALTKMTTFALSVWQYAQPFIDKLPIENLPL
jgi:bifunctional N-acetylglucosamine-1-phosphate-uridyltransferase/glucosamine-1-phosphate-acetyltransferase GlmU-like protein